MDTGCFADRDPDFKNPDPDPSNNKLMGSNHLNDVFDYVLEEPD